MSDTTVGIAFALVASVSWAAGSVFIRLGLERVGSRTATFLSVVTGLVYVLTVALILDASAFLDVTVGVVLGFTVVGILSFGAGRFLYYVSVSLMGVGRATAIGGATPIVAAAMAVVFLGEVLTLPLTVGIFAVAGGIGLIVSQEPGAAGSSLAQASSSRGLRRAVLFGILASIASIAAYGVAQIVIKSLVSGGHHR